MGTTIKRMRSFLLCAALLLPTLDAEAGGFEAGQRRRSFSSQRIENVFDGSRDVRSLFDSRVSWQGVGSSEQMIDDLLIDLNGLQSRTLATEHTLQLEDDLVDPTIRVRQESANSFSGFRISGSEHTRVRSQILDRYRGHDRLQESGEESGSFVSSF
ncbi:MAG: hypothetical protein VKN13_02790 [Cyanobacteriota bacterium]|nr:hypothetical protein [Cyanobacteriota bacterium]